MTPAPTALPVLPAAQARALTLASRHDVGIPELAGVVESDPALTIAVLRAANTASQAPLQRVLTASDAIVRIGLNATRRVVTATATNSAFGDIARAGIDLDAFWEHTLATALLADASAWPNGPRTEAFTTGLLHDIGRLALASADPERYRFVVRRVQGGASPDEAERTVFGVDHITVGRDVAAACGLPPQIVDAIAQHHVGEGSALAWVTFNGRSLAALLGFGDGVSVATPAVPVESGPGGAIVRSLGGPAGIRMKIGWYRGLFVARAAA